MKFNGPIKRLPKFIIRTCPECDWFYEGRVVDCPLCGTPGISAIWNYKSKAKRLFRTQELWHARQKAIIDPINPYTGEVSVLQIAKNLENGHTKFPENMGDPKG
jgi:hypothetical protein